MFSKILFACLLVPGLAFAQCRLIPEKLTKDLIMTETFREPIQVTTSGVTYTIGYSLIKFFIKSNGDISYGLGLTVISPVSDKLLAHAITISDGSPNLLLLTDVTGEGETVIIGEAGKMYSSFKYVVILTDDEYGMLKKMNVQAMVINDPRRSDKGIALRVPYPQSISDMIACLNK